MPEVALQNVLKKNQTLAITITTGENEKIGAAEVGRASRRIRLNSGFLVFKPA